MLLDRDLTIQEMFFDKAIQINPVTVFDAGGINASNMASKVDNISMDIEADQFHTNSDFFEKLGQHLAKNWGWYIGGAAAIVIVVHFYTWPNEKEKATKQNGFKSII